MCVRVCMYVCMYIYMYGYIYVRLPACGTLRINVCVCVYVRMYVYIYVWIYICATSCMWHSKSKAPFARSKVLWCVCKACVYI